MKCIIAARTPAIEQTLDALGRIPLAETGRAVNHRFVPSTGDDALAREMQDGKCLIISDAQTAAAHVFSQRVPDGGVLVLGASAGLAGKGLLRELLRDKMLDARHVSAFGVRRWSLEEHDFVMRQRVQFYGMIEISREGLAEMTDAVMMYVRQWRAFHLVVNLDAVDPAFAPGLRSPCAGGFTSRELLYVVQRLVLIQSMASAELILDADADHATARLAAQLIAEFA